jgi:hypothetical protein
MIKGFLEAVSGSQVTGWAYDPDNQFESLSVVLEGNGESLGSTTADQYRHDLAAAGYGNGCHAFALSLEKQLAEENLASVRAYVLRRNGERILLQSLSAPSIKDTKGRQQISFDGQPSDSTKFPLFVLGAARSGTSAMAQALLQLERFDGKQEGHALDLLAYFSASLEQFYANKAGELNRDTMLAGISPDYFSDALDRMFCDLAAKYYSKDFWIEKTPNANSVSLAPRFRKLWPNARFIFMKRRAIENVKSRETKFSDLEFSDHCLDWVRVMSAWGVVREQLKGCAVEVDQLFLAQQPDAAGEFIAQFLGLDASESERLGAFFRTERPERTGFGPSPILTRDDLGWDDQKWQTFIEICADTMDYFNYGLGSDYFKNDSADGMSRVI